MVKKDRFTTGFNTCGTGSLIEKVGWKVHLMPRLCRQLHCSLCVVSHTVYCAKVKEDWQSHELMRDDKVKRIRLGDRKKNRLRPFG